MKLVDNWSTILTKAWSTRLLALLVILEAVSLTLPELVDLISPRAFAVISLALPLIIMVVRIIAQPSIHAQPENTWPDFGETIAPPGTCQLPPPGWYCSAEAGHAGPCPTWPEAKS